MSFSWERMKRTPEAGLERAQQKVRDTGSLESLAEGYAAQAKEMLQGKDGAAISEEIAGFSQKIREARVGSEQEDQLDRLHQRLKLRRPGAFELIPEEDRERQAFTLALVGAYQRSLQ